jgi:hypothetical protein
MRQDMATRKVFWLVSTKAKGLKFRVLKLNKEEKRATLQGETGVPFETGIAQEQLDKLGYIIEITNEEVPDALLSDQPA